MTLYTPDNLILRAAAKVRRPELESQIKHLPYEPGHQFWDFGAKIPYALFPVRGVVSFQLAPPGEEEHLEVGLVGFEGFAGVSLFLGSDVAGHRTVAMTAGEGLTMPRRVFGEYLKAPIFKTAVEQHVCLLVLMLATISMCQRVHSIDKVAVGRLLLIHDRLRSDTVHLTQESLSSILGVRRATVNQVISNLRQQGAVDTVPGRLLILNRDQLERSACPCYHQIKTAYDKFVKAR